MARPTVNVCCNLEAPFGSFYGPSEITRDVVFVGHRRSSTLPDRTLNEVAGESAKRNWLTAIRVEAKEQLHYFVSFRSLMNFMSSWQEQEYASHAGGPGFEPLRAHHSKDKRFKNG